MSLKRKKELQTKTKEELGNMLKESRKALFELSIDHSRNKVKNTAELSAKRKEIARMLTFMKEKETAKNG